MIEGLKYTLTGATIASLAKEHAKKIRSEVKGSVIYMSVEEMELRRAEELEVLAEYVKASETYLLSADDMRKLGAIKL